MKRWCIVNTKGLRGAAIYDEAPLGCDVLDGNYRPKCFYYDKERAEKELLRLSDLYGNHFQLFESVARTETQVVRVMNHDETVSVIEIIEHE